VASAADLIVRIKTEGDTRNLDNAAGAADKWGKRSAAAATALAASSAAIIAFGSSAVKSASRTQQAMGGVDAVFGANAATVKRWAKGAADSVGLAGSQYAEFAALIGTQLKNSGLPMDVVLGKTKDLIRLGSDLAATYGGTTADAVGALTSALKGEFDPMDRFGGKLSAAAIAAEMAAEGTDKLTGSAASQAKTMATLNLITKQTADAQGQFSKQSNTAAEQAQIASAHFEDMKSALGTSLLPVITAVTGVLGRLAVAVGEHPKIAQAAAAAILILTVALFGLITVTKVYTSVQTLAAAASGAAWLAALGPILLVALAIGAVIAIVVLLWKRSQTFRAIVLGVWSAVRTAAVATGNAVKAVWNAVWSVLRAGAAAYIAYWRALWNAARAVVSAVASAVRAAWGAVWGPIRSGANGAASAVRSAFNGLLSAAHAVASSIKNAFTSAFSALRGAASGLASALSAPFNAIRSAINGVISAVQSLIGWLGRIHVPKIKIPHIPGVSGAAVAPAVAGPFAARTASAYGAAPRVAAPGARSTSSTAPGAVVINVNGALDPEAVARQIRRLLGAHGQRTGAAVVFR
jgi:hypothetical protein